jgi:hypothetical protein
MQLGGILLIEVVGASQPVFFFSAHVLDELVSLRLETSAATTASYLIK